MRHNNILTFTQMLKGISIMLTVVMLLLSPHISKKVKQEMQDREAIQAQLNEYKIKIARK
jgi:hypothetical protein